MFSQLAATTHPLATTHTSPTRDGSIHHLSHSAVPSHPYAAPSNSISTFLETMSYLIGGTTSTNSARSESVEESNACCRSEESRLYCSSFAWMASERAYIEPTVAGSLELWRTEDGFASVKRRRLDATGSIRLQGTLISIRKGTHRIT